MIWHIVCCFKCFLGHSPYLVNIYKLYLLCPTIVWGQEKGLARGRFIRLVAPSWNMHKWIHTYTALKSDQISILNYTKEETLENLNDLTKETSWVVEEPELEHNLNFLQHHDFYGLKECLLFSEFIHTMQLHYQNWTLLVDMWHVKGWCWKAVWKYWSNFKYWFQWCRAAIHTVLCMDCSQINLHTSFNSLKLSKVGIYPFIPIFHRGKQAA